MSDAVANSASNSNDPSFVIQRIYLKDLSLEQPNAPSILLVASEPQIQVELDIAVDRLSDELFEVALLSTVTARVDGKVMFLVEAKQAGIFEFKNIPPEQIDPMLVSHAQRSYSHIYVPMSLMLLVELAFSPFILQTLIFMECTSIVWRKLKQRRAHRRALATQKARSSFLTNENYRSWWWCVGYGNRPICCQPSAASLSLFMGTQYRAD